MSYRYMRVPMGMNYNMIKINHLSNFALEALLKNDFTRFGRQKMDEYNINIKEEKRKSRLLW